MDWRRNGLYYLFLGGLLCASVYLFWGKEMTQWVKQSASQIAKKVNTVKATAPSKLPQRSEKIVQTTFNPRFEWKSITISAVRLIDFIKIETLRESVSDEKHQTLRLKKILRKS